MYDNVADYDDDDDDDDDDYYDYYIPLAISLIISGGRAPKTCIFPVDFVRTIAYRIIP